VCIVFHRDSIAAVQLPPMTDREIAVKIGSEVLRLRAQVSTLRGVLMSCREYETGRVIPWPAMVEHAENEPALVRIADERRELLVSTLDHLAKEDSQLIRPLYDAILVPEW
jgi:hypothetical protein